MCLFGLFVFQAEDGIRDLVRSRGLGDVYKRQVVAVAEVADILAVRHVGLGHEQHIRRHLVEQGAHCLLYTSDAADERSSVDLGGRRIIKKKTNIRIQNERSETRRINKSTT